MKQFFKRTISLLLILTLLVSCTPKGDVPTTESTSSSEPVKEVNSELVLDHEEELLYAKNFTLTHYKDGYKMFTVSSAPDKKFLLVPEGKEAPSSLDGDVVILKAPIQRIHMVSTGMAALCDAIGGLDRVASTGTPAKKWFVDEIKKRVESGKIKFAGSYSAPDFETLTGLNIDLEIDTTMLSSKPEIQKKYEELGIPVIIETSSKEGHPLGKVEWIKLIGAIVDKEKEANEFFLDSVKKVEEVSKVPKSGKTVAMFYVSPTNNTVSARNGGDYMAKMIELAGGEYIMKDVNPQKSGLEKMNYEEVYTRCKDADIVFYLNYFKDQVKNIDDFYAINDLFKEFKAVKEGRLYITSSSYTQDIVNLANMIKDMHDVISNPDLEETRTMKKLH
ncbi:ABC transporter substrate-binding protein [Guggenheimella bovis]